jgi:hypothetical protein
MYRTITRIGERYRKLYNQFILIPIQFSAEILDPVDNPFLSPCRQIFPRLLVTNIYKYLSEFSGNRWTGVPEQGEGRRERENK